MSCVQLKKSVNKSLCIECNYESEFESSATMNRDWLEHKDTCPSHCCFKKRGREPIETWKEGVKDDVKKKQDGVKLTFEGLGQTVTGQKEFDQPEN